LLTPCLSLNALVGIMGKRRSHRSLQKRDNLLHLELFLGLDTGTYSFFNKRKFNIENLNWTKDGQFWILYNNNNNSRVMIINRIMSRVLRISVGVSCSADRLFSLSLKPSSYTSFCYFSGVSTVSFSLAISSLLEEFRGNSSIKNIFFGTL
jgi:hypothetical protein